MFDGAQKVPTSVSILDFILMCWYASMSFLSHAYLDVNAKALNRKKERDKERKKERKVFVLTFGKLA